MYKQLKEKSYYANMRLNEEGLIKFTWGNASEIDREKGVLAIKPSGVSYESLKPDDIVIVDIATGKVVEGTLNPSSDLATHLVIAREFPEVKGIVHTHSKWATIFSQAGKSVKAYGTTHADCFYGTIPCTRDMKPEEIETEYEHNTGVVIAETFKKLSPLEIPGVLVKNHGPFTWGKDANQAVDHAVVLEEVCMMAAFTELLGSQTQVSSELLDKHFLRKHGKNAYYGQKKQ